MNHQSHLFGDLLSQHLHRKHGLTQSKLAAGILQEPAIITRMCKGERLTGPQARERVIAIIGWLRSQDALVTTDEANALLLAAGLAPLRESATAERMLLHKLRNLPGPLPIAPPQTPPMPVSEFSLVGRQAEWQMLRVAWQAALQGKAQFVTLAGEAGIGKTRLAEELMAESMNQGYAVARTRAYEMEGCLAYAPLAEWLRSPALANSVAALHTVWRSELARLLPELLVYDPSLAPPQPLRERWQLKQLFDAILQAITLAQQNRPLLLVLDDMQWCDAETLDWLHYALGTAPHLKLGVVGTVRDTDVGSDHPLHSFWRHLLQDGQLTHIALSPLNRNETASLGASVAQENLDAEVAARLFQDCAGNPLFVIESVRPQQDASRSAILSDMVAIGNAKGNSNGNRQNSPIAPPPKVQAVIQARLAQLSPAAREVAEFAAVIGRSFSLTLMTRVSNLGDEDVMRAMDELWRARILYELGIANYDFSHDRIRDVAYAEISPIRLRRLHNWAAQALESANPDQLNAVAGELAEHHLRAGDIRKAVTYFRQAAKVAKQIYAHREAIRFIEKAISAIQLATDHAEFGSIEIDLWYELGMECIVVYDYGSKPVEEAWSKASALSIGMGNRFQRGRALLALSAIARNQGRWRTCREHIELAIPMAEDSSDTFLLGTLLGDYGGTLYHFGEFEYALQILRRNVTLSNEGAPPSFLWIRESISNVTHARVAKCLWFLGFFDQARMTSEAAINIAQTQANLFDKFLIFDFVIMLHTFMRNFAEVRTLSEQLGQMARQYEFPTYRREGHIYYGWAMAHQGNAHTFVDQVRESVEGHQASGSRQFEPYWRGLLAETLMLAGQLDDALREIDNAIAYADKSNNLYWSSHLLKLKGDCLQTVTASNTAVETHYQQALILARKQGAKSIELRTSVSLARLWKRQGKYGEAHKLLSKIRSWFTEGFNTLDLQEANALLAELT